MVPPSALRGAARAALTLALVLFPALAFAVGPVAPSSLPGGVTVSDNDSGSGEQWGRPGGRTIIFNVNTPSAFSSLSWGAASQPTAALDGVVNSPSETMSFNIAESNLSSGIARWNGVATVLLSSPSSTISVETRFTLEVTIAAGTPLSLGFIGGGPTPGSDVLAVGQFHANLLFEGRHSSVNGGLWTPLLNLYDALATPAGNPPGTSGPALTGFAHGFYYELVSSGPPTGGMTVEDHDSNVTSRLIGIRDDTAFLRIDTVGRFQNVQTKLDEIRTRVNGLPTTGIASSEDVSSAKEDLTQMLLILFGLMPCPAEAGPLCDSAIFIQDLATQSSVDSISTRATQLGTQLDAIEASLGGLASANPLIVEVIEVPDPPSPKHRRWIVKTTQGGALVDASLSRILSIRSKKQLPALAEDVTFSASAMAIGPGLLDVTLETSAGNGETVVYQIEVQHAGGGGTSAASALRGTGAK